MVVNNLVARKKIEWIAYTYELTDHAKERIRERKDLDMTIKQLILKTPLAWITSEGYYCLALGLKEFMVLKIRENEDGTQTPVILTYIHITDENKSAVDRFIKDYNKSKELITNETE